MVEADNKRRKQIKGLISEFNIATRDRKEGEVTGCVAHTVCTVQSHKQDPKLGNSYSAITLLKFLILFDLVFCNCIWWVHGVCLGLSLTPKSHGVSLGLVHFFCGSDPFLFVVI